TFRTYRNRISTITEHITEYHIFQALLIVFPGHIQCHILHSTQFVSVLFVLLQLLLTETTRVCTSCIHFIPFFLSQIHYSERGIKPPAECHYYFFLLFFHNDIILIEN